MASNPQWCLSLDEWRGTFADWIQRLIGDGQTLLNSQHLLRLPSLFAEACLLRRAAAVAERLRRPVPHVPAPDGHQRARQPPAARRGGGTFVTNAEGNTSTSSSTARRPSSTRPG